MVHVYNTKVSWDGDRNGRIVCGNGYEGTFSAAPEFKGAAGGLTPEDAFVASMNMGFMVTMLAFLEQKGVHLKGYECDVNGILGARKGNDAIIRVVIHPKLTVARSEDIETVNWAIEKAKRYCVSLNSFVGTIVVEHKVDIAE